MENNKRILTSSTENLQNVENTEIDESTLSGIVDLSTLDDDGISGQIDSPSECSGTAENLSKNEI